MTSKRILFMNKKKVHFQIQNCLLISLFLFFFIFMARSAYAGETQEKFVRVGAFDGSYTYTNSSGEHSGYGYEFQQAVSAYTGWTYGYISCDWTDCFKKLENGSIDMLGGVSYT